MLRGQGMRQTSRYFLPYQPQTLVVISSKEQCMSKLPILLCHDSASVRINPIRTYSHLQSKEEVPPLSPLNENSDQHTTKCSTNRCGEAKESKGQVAQLARRKGNSNLSNDIRHHESSSNSTESSSNSERDDTLRAEPID